MPGSPMTPPAAPPAAAAAPPAHSGVEVLLLRLAGAALQILATLAVVHALTPEATGIYFRGVVMALGLSTLLRGKYEIYMAQHIIGRRAGSTGHPDGLLLMQFAGRLLARSALVCAILLVVTADLDISAPQLQTALQTYLPFVLALPFLSLSALLGEALRAAGRTLGIVVTAYAVNASIVLAVVLIPPNAPLALYSWAFLLGSVLAAAAAVLLARHSFPAFLSGESRPLASEVQREVDSRELISLVRAALLWGPQCILALWAPALQMAQFAVAQRTALVVDFFLPAWNLASPRETLVPGWPQAAPRGLLLRQLAGACLVSSAFVLGLLLAAPATLAIYGRPYDAQLPVYALLLGVQWANGIGRPAVRRVLARWDERRIGVALTSGAVAAVLLCSAALAGYGALAAAAGALLGTLIVNARAILMALSDQDSGGPPSGSPPVSTSHRP
jgi:hypothetical protein